MAKDEIKKRVFGDKVVFIESSISHKSMSGMIVLFTTQQHNNSGDHKWDDKDTKKLRYSTHSTVGNEGVSQIRGMKPERQLMHVLL